MAKKRNKKISYTEFLAWLDGVEDMHPGDWHPDPDQWKTIRAKLSSVIPDKDTVSAAPITTLPAGVVPGMPTQSTFEEHPRVKRALPSAMQTMGQGVNQGVLPATKPQNIDSSDGSYESLLV